MKSFSRNYWVLAFIMILTSVFLFGCATHTKPAQPEEKSPPPAAMKEEPAKPIPEPAKKELPPVPEPSKKELPAAPTAPTASPSPPTTTTSPIPTPVPEGAKEPAQRTTEIALPLVNLREGPSMNHKIIRVLKGKTKLSVLEEKLGWLRVRLEDGVEGWVAKSMTSEGIQPTPAAPPKGRK